MENISGIEGKPPRGISRGIVAPLLFALLLAPGVVPAAAADPAPDPAADLAPAEARRDEGRPRGPDDPILPPAGAAPGVWSKDQLDFFIPRHVAYPTEEALAFFKDLAAKEPADARHLGRAAKTAYELARLGEAFALASAAVALSPSDPWGLYVLALLHQGRFEHTRAVELLERLIAVDRLDFDGRAYLTRPYLLATLAWSHLKLGRPDRAEAAFRRAYEESEGRDALALKMYERHLTRAGRIVEAQALYERNLERRPDDLNALVNLAALLAHRGFYDRAIPLLERADRLDPGNMRILYYLHRAHFRRGDRAEALDYLRRAAALDVRAQIRKEYDENQRLVPLPVTLSIATMVHVALGSEEVLLDVEDMHVKHHLFLDESEKNPPPYFKEEVCQDDALEYSHEEAMAFYFGSRPELVEDPARIIDNRFLSALEAHLLPRSSAAVALFREASRHLVGIRWESALSAAESGLALEPSCPGLMMQVAVATRKLARTDRLFDLIDRLKGWRPDPALPAATAARSLALLACLEPFVIDRHEGARGIEYGRTEQTRDLTDARLAEFAALYENLYTELLALRRASDSITELSLTGLLVADVCIGLSLFHEAGAHYEFALEHDPGFRLIRRLYARFGRSYMF